MVTIKLYEVSSDSFYITLPVGFINTLEVGEVLTYQRYRNDPYDNGQTLVIKKVYKPRLWKNILYKLFKLQFRTNEVKVKILKNI